MSLNARTSRTAEKRADSSDNSVTKSEESMQAEANPSVSKPRTNPWHIACGSVMLLLVLFGVYQCANLPPASIDSILENSKVDGSVYVVRRYLDENLKDPGSYQGIEWSPVAKLESGKYLVRHKYRAKNSFGGYAIEEQIFVYNSDGKIESVKKYQPR